MADFLFETAKEYYEQDDYEQALCEFKKVVLVDPEHLQALMYIQIIEEELGLIPLQQEEQETVLSEKIEGAERESAMALALEQVEGLDVSEEAAAEPEPEPEPKAEPEPTLEEKKTEIEKELPLAPELVVTQVEAAVISEEETAIVEPELEPTLEEIEVKLEQAFPEAPELVVTQVEAAVISEEEEIVVEPEQIEEEPVSIAEPVPDVIKVSADNDEEEIEIEETLPLETETRPILAKPYPVLDKGESFIEVYTKYYWHNTRFDEGGNRKRWDYNGRGHEVQTELKIEHALTDNLHLLTAIPHKIVLWKDDYNRNTTNGIGDIWMKLRYEMYEQADLPFYFSLQPGLRVPGGYDENASPSLGDGEIAGELRFLAAWSFTSFPAYANIETGFRGRAEEQTNEIPYFFGLGYRLGEGLMLKTTIDGVEGLAGVGGDEEEDYTKWSAHIIYSPKGRFFRTFGEEAILNFELNYGNTFEGKNATNGSEIVFNIMYQF